MGELEPILYCSACGNRVESRFVHGKDRPVCVECGKVHFREPKVAAAVLIEEDGKILLVRRVNTPYQGHWTLPAGFVDGAEDPRVAAARECLEETGLRIEIGNLLDVIHGLEHPNGASIVIAYQGRVIGGTLEPQDDADAADFFPPDRLPPLGFQATRKLVRLWLGKRNSSLD
jgi:ADP-ribose pyrophosphatase YjhB (NUDIX family)